MTTKKQKKKADERRKHRQEHEAHLLRLNKELRKLRLVEAEYENLMRVQFSTEERIEPGQITVTDVAQAIFKLAPAATLARRADFDVMTLEEVTPEGQKL